MTNPVSDSISSLFAFLGSSNGNSTSATSKNGDQFMALLDGLFGSASGSGKSNSDSINNLFGGDTSSMGMSSTAFSMLNSFGGNSNNTSDIDALAVQDTLAGNGPLPNYLKQVDAGMHLTATQQQALQDIAIKNINTDGSASSISEIAKELQTAGI